MTNPVLVEVTRGETVESRHRGAVVVADARGRRIFEAGDVEEAVFPRSAVKAFQALALIESGAADACRFGKRELALASASHSGEPEHVATAAAMLASVGCGEGDLECGRHMPIAEEAARRLIRAGAEPNQLHNNCSGKHAGFICVACHAGVSPLGYVGADHPVQRQVTGILADMTGTRLDETNRAIDGCSIPTYAIPLDRLASGFAGFIGGEGLEPERATAARRLAEACMAEPFLVAGTGRFDTEVMAALPRQVFVKGGAEGVYCAAFPASGLGVAMKCDDGTPRAVEAMMAAVIAAFLRTGDDTLMRRLRAPVLTRRGRPVGETRPVAGFLDALRVAAPG
jgi:L-asparaginase II